MIYLSWLPIGDTNSVRNETGRRVGEMGAMNGKKMT